MAEASVPQDLSSYEYEPSCPLPSGREARDHVISKGPCQPRDINFPLDNRNRKFLVSWYEKFPWLEYSVSLDKAFCFVCRVFNAQTSSRSEPTFIKTGFSNWKKSEVFAKHEKSDCHKHSLQAHRHWKSQKPIHHQIDEENERQESYRQQNVKKNRTVIGKIIDVVRLLGKLNLPFRGHREDKNSLNKGVFKEFLEHIAKSDSLIEDHLRNSAENAKYTSPEIQNQLIKVVGSAILDEIIRRVKGAEMYAIIADETPDLSKTEQLAVLVRYVWNGVIEERLLAVEPMEETTAEALSIPSERNYNSVG
ncbi:Hypothetical predicted protein [Paramuricea clavata]|uniref:Uncharacterized protein n=1 Tax=Paramuricea clavata TaxID=317549 RepID=A0A6S7HI44_PARCT|nr:Hypothetical predicted protein [Paramuricea clavata]